MDFDYHTHTNYSDGGSMSRMVRAAEELGLKQLGFADHANVSNRTPMKKYVRKFGFNLDMTYKRRRKAIQELQEETEIKLFDAVEMDYNPRDEKEVVEFLEKADFDYSIGSIHHIEDKNIHSRRYFEKKTEEEQYKAVDRYFELLVEMIESEIFDIAAHIDLVERNPALRGKPTTEQYEKVAKAFKKSSTVPEINGGRATYGLNELHPMHKFQEILESEGIKFTLGTDSHTAEELKEVTLEIRKQVEERDIEIQKIF